MRIKKDILFVPAILLGIVGGWIGIMEIGEYFIQK